MTAVYYAIFAVSAAVLVGATVVRAIGYARSPMHLRWELYPVPHESPSHARHGGSRYEESDWWVAPVHRDRLRALQAVATEVLLLQGLRSHNPRLWRRSYPFHAGLYLLICTASLLLFAAAITILAPQSMNTWFGRSLTQLYRITGLAGSISAVIGAAGLLHRRLTDEDLRPYTAPGDIFNLAWFVIALGLLAIGYALRPAGASGVLTCLVGLLTWDTTVAVPALFGAGLVLTALLGAYIPFTHMSHFVGKYFTYHAVRWDDEPSRRGGDIEKKLAEYLTYRPTWSASHLGADGKKTWAEVATSNPASPVKR